MATSQTDICNLALGEIQSKAIDNIADNTNEARWCRRFYDSARDEMLRSGLWNFAIKRVTLTELSEVPLNEWNHQFQLPVDFIRGASLNAQPWSHSALWVIEGRALLTNCSTAILRYVFRQDDTSTYDPLFVRALGVLLASKIAAPITGDRQKAAELLSRYVNIDGPNARRIDANEAKPRVMDPVEDSRLVGSRFLDGYSGASAYPGDYTYVAFP